MTGRNQRLLVALGGLLWALLAGQPALADDTEMFVYDSSALPVSPNVLFIFDTSGSMGTEVESQAAFDPAKTYSGSCDASRVYWRFGTGDAPSCSTDRWFEASALKCKSALDAFGSTSGYVVDHVAAFDSGSATWQGLDQSQKARVVECRADSGTDGGGDSAEVYAHDGDAAHPWTADAAQEINWWSVPAATLYSANYLNWFYGATGPSTRSQVMKDVAKGLLGSVHGVNIGLMSFNSDGVGGHLVQAVKDVDSSRDALAAAIDALPTDSMTPLSETLYEASLYFLGRHPDYGAAPHNTDAQGVGVGADGNYDSPAQYACQKNYIVYLTDGEPQHDSDADSKILALTDNAGQRFADLVGASCDKETYPDGFHPSGGDCLDDLAAFLHKGDLSGTLPGKQNVTTYTVGFTADLPILQQTAERGGGRYYTADDTASLSQALTNIVTSILETQSTFASPAVSVNTFDQIHNGNNVYVTMFEPAGTAHWPGNLKKYSLSPTDASLVDQNGQPAVDSATGFFTDTAQSWWTARADGSEVTLGGAAAQLPEPGARHLYTYLGSADLSDASNAVSTANAGLTDAVLHVGDPGDPARADVIDFMRGVDVADSNENNSKTDTRRQIGDPLHSQPVVMVYGGTLAQPNPEDAVVYFATNDGYLHAVDPSTGAERWAFVPPEFLGDQAELLENPTVASKHYGIDGSLRLQVVANDDGVIDPATEKVYLFFGMRRGGSVYYGLDVTDPSRPKLLWRRDPTVLTGLGQTWSNPVPTRIAVAGADENPDDLVVVLGGGYDSSQDGGAASTDGTGNDVYIVDSVSGNLLWRGTKTGGTKNFGRMDYSIPADIKVIDLDGDGYADRMYAADMGGQVWRFDITNGQSASSLVNGGVIAQLGAGGLASPTPAQTRRFYYAPDVALVSNKAQSFLHIGIGSGYRAHPNSADNADRFYALRDYAPFRQLTQAEFDARTPVQEGDLTDITDTVDAKLAADSPGWMLRLAPGEKVLAEARTFDDKVYFTTFTPGASLDANHCTPQLGTNKLYVVSLFNGAPVTNLDAEVVDANAQDGSNSDAALTSADRSRQIPGSIPNEVRFVFPTPEADCQGDACTPKPLACVGLSCTATDFADEPRRTIWTESAVDR